MPEIKTTIKLQIPAGKANPAPPVGPTLGQHGLNIQDFCTRFNNATKDKKDIIPVEITVYQDNSFDFKLKTPPAASLLKKAAGKSGKVSQSELRKIAQEKLADLNAYNLEAAEKIIAGTAKSMGLEVAK